MAKQRLDQPHRVRIPASARIVLGIGQDHRAPAGLGQTLGLLHRFIRFIDLAGEIRLRLADHRYQPIRCPIRGQAGFGIGQHRGPAIGDVRRRKAGREG
jgi:hypothetical protein